jgi:hypothetical protein
MQALLQPNDPSKPTDQTTLPLDKLAFIIYSNNNDAQCNADLFKMTLVKTIYEGETEMWL